MSTSTETVQLFGHWICPFSVRVSFALAVKNIDHTVVDVPPTAARPQGFVVPEAFIANSGKGEIPLLRIGTTYLADSIPILEWLDDRFLGSWQNSSAVTECCTWIDANIFPPMIGLYYGTADAEIARASAVLDHRLRELADLLGTRPWLVGDGPSRAEAVLVPLYVRLQGLRQLGWTGELPSGVALHAERTISLHGAEQVVWSQVQTDEFVARFLAYRRKITQSKLS